MNAATRRTNWQISVIPAIEKTIIITVPANCSTAKLYDELKKHPLAPVAEQYILISHEGQLEYSKKKYLSDYDIQNKSVIQLVVRVKGGVWPSVGDIVARARILEASERIQITMSDKHPDVFGLDLDDTPRAIMSCGHAVAPLSLALYCYHELQKGEESINCPDSKCGSRWKFSQISEAACLSAKESKEFERKALFNGMRKKQEEIKSCPNCNAFCTRSSDRDKRVVCSNCTSSSGDQYEFCWKCLCEWKDNYGTENCGNPKCGDNKEFFRILATCALKELNGVQCPSQRACPKCFTILEHSKDCKHMTCSGCKYEFCFICLKPYPCLTDVWVACDVAPRQASESVESHQNKTKHLKSTWQLTIDYDRRFLLTVTADCLVEEFFRTLYYHPMAPKVCGYRVIYGDDELHITDGKRLSEYGIQRLSTLTLMISLTGG